MANKPMNTTLPIPKTPEAPKASPAPPAPPAPPPAPPVATEKTNGVPGAKKARDEVRKSRKSVFEAEADATGECVERTRLDPKDGYCKAFKVIDGSGTVRYVVSSDPYRALLAIAESQGWSTVKVGTVARGPRVAPTGIGSVMDMVNSLPEDQRAVLLKLIQEKVKV